MNQSGQGQGEARRQHNEAIISRHLHQLFRRLPMLSGFWLYRDLRVAEVVCTWTSDPADRDLCDHVMASIVQIAQECPEAAQLMRGRTFARALH